MAVPSTKQKMETPKSNPYLMQLKIVLIMTLSHFETPDLLDEQRMEHAMEAGRQILLISQKQTEVRLALGLSKEIWVALTGVLSQAIPLLERQSFAIEDPNAPGYTGSTSNYIAGNFVPLLKDVERINELCTIARNLLATKQEVQDLAAEAKLDQNILKLTDVCVRVAARGYDGEVGTRTEEKWQRVVNAYKKLLITCLQFLHNLVMNNERRKLLLWMDLFGSSPCADPSFMGRVDPAAYFQPEDYIPREQFSDSIQAQENSITIISESAQPELDLVRECGLQMPAGTQAMTSHDVLDNELSPPQMMETQSANSSQGPALAEIRARSPKGKERANSLPSQPMRNAKTPDQISTHTRETIDRISDNLDGASVLNGRTIVSPLLTASNFTGLNALRASVLEDDEVIACHPTDAAHNLRMAKEQLIDRLFGRHESPGQTGTENEVDDNPGNDHEDIADASDAAAQGSLEDEEEAYHRPGDQERGLLTDIPLVLGPSEIEALPMIIQTGVVDSFASKNPEGIHENMQAIRCNILISQESGRYLLRELLIFIAAWDLREDEIYYKMMVQIMESILINGLVPYTYSSFAETKDIISPAQAVIIKLLTQIFRGKLAKNLPSLSKTGGRLPFLRVHILVIRFIFAQFRQSVIPETCGLIYLQGQIRAGQITAEDFPLNLWDVERVYEGIYQYLEFFAVLSEIEGWKRLLVKWEIAFELIVLLRELEDAIPKGQLLPSPSETTRNAGSTGNEASSRPNQPKPISVERPFDRNPTSPTTTSIMHNSPAPPGADNPEEFEWRNLKKLVVLVLSSLVWKSPTVQDQVRNHGGVELILQCCNYDSHNPYIREHAIMCLRFVLEGNEANSQIVRDLEARQVVPSEVLDERGYETFIDAKGKVGLRRKDTVH